MGLYYRERRRDGRLCRGERFYGHVMDRKTVTKDAVQFCGTLEAHYDRTGRD